MALVKSSPMEPQLPSPKKERGGLNQDFFLKPVVIITFHQILQEIKNMEEHFMI